MMETADKQTYQSIEALWRDVHQGNADTGFILFHVNVRSLKKNGDELNARLQPYFEKIDVVVLSETNIKDEEFQLYSCNNFESFSHNRTGRKGGGIMVLTNNKWQILRK